MKKKMIVILMILCVFVITAGCSSPQEEAEPEVVWDTLPLAEQSINVTVTDAAREHMEDDWEQKTSNTALFMLIPGSS